MKKRNIIFIILFLVFQYFIPSHIYAKQSLKIAIFTPRNKDDMFYSQVIDFMRASCNDLGIELTVFYGNNDHLYMTQQIQQASKEKKFDALVVSNFKQQLKYVAQILNKNKTPFFIYNAGFSKEDNPGKPREKFKYWIGEMLPDDKKAGYDLSKIISDAITKKQNKIVHLVGLGGNIADQASIERIKGLNSFVQESKGKVILDQVTYANWLPSIAEEKFPLIHSRYPKTVGYWTASDGMALGIANQSKKINFFPIIGGVDWSQDGITAVKNKKIFATIGGHFMEGAWVSIILYDYFNGIDFKKSEGLNIKSWMSPITYENVDNYLNTLGKKENWKKINFKSLSKKYNSKLKKYNFSQEIILSQLK